MKPLLIFYALVFYVLLQFSWWAFLLVKLNDEVYEQKKMLITANASGREVQQQELLHLSKKLHERWLMIAGEGAVFLTLLIVGIKYTRNSFRKEFELSRQKKNFLLSVTHEFKSPLAAIKLSLQTVIKHKLNIEKQTEILNRSLHETERLQSLVENALLASQIENKSVDLNKVELNLTELISEQIRNSELLGELIHKVETRLDSDVYFFGDALALQSVLSNLLENAKKYAPAGSVILIELIERKHHVIIRVTDQGPGILPEEKEKIFEKFYRVENEETRQSKGTGLGLFIVQQIIQMHNGKIFVKDNQPQGTIFEIIFKKSG